MCAECGCGIVDGATTGTATFDAAEGEILIQPDPVPLVEFDPSMIPSEE